jgi:hypothetical protein
MRENQQIPDQLQDQEKNVGTEGCAGTCLRDGAWTANAAGSICRLIYRQSFR